MVAPFWESLTPTRQSDFYAATQSANMKYLMQWHLLQFQVQPLNFHEYDHLTETDWARKEIAGAAVYREWTGEGDEVLNIRGRLFPYRIDGDLDAIEQMESLRRQGLAGPMMRGDGHGMGWYVCEKLRRGHKFISAQGIGQLIEFDAMFARCPVPSGEWYYSQLQKALRA